MKLKALDQIHISAVQADSLRKGQVFQVSDALGAELLDRHPETFRRLDRPKPPAKPRGAAKPRAKAAKAPRNKMAATPPNKGETEPGTGASKPANGA